MTELLVYEIITDLRSLGFEDVYIEETMLDIDWVDDLDYMEEIEDEENYE